MGLLPIIMNLSTGQTGGGTPPGLTAYAVTYNGVPVLYNSVQVYVYR